MRVLVKGFPTVTFALFLENIVTTSSKVAAAYTEFPSLEIARFVGFLADEMVAVDIGVNKPVD